MNLTLKQVLLWILTPFTVLLGIIVLLLGKLGEAKRTISVSKIDKELAEAVAAKEAAKRRADADVSEWDKVRSSYFNSDGSPKL
jgi:hypothetical protein